MNSPQSESLQRQPLPKQEDEKLDRKPTEQNLTGSLHPIFAENSLAVSPSLEAAIQHARNGGHALPEQEREPMEGAFGADFSGVRLHTGEEANRLNHAMQAKAFTTGRDIFFRQGAYNLGNQQGQKLLAHELTHVVQQANSRSTHPIILREETYPTIRAETPEEAEASELASRSFNIQILRIVAIGYVAGLLKIDFRISRGGGPWIDCHFYGAGPGAGVEIPVLERPSAIETHTTRHFMRIRDLMGRGRVFSIGVPSTNVKYFRLDFVGGPERAGFSTVTWTLQEGIRQPFAAGLYFGQFAFGHRLQA